MRGTEAYKQLTLEDKLKLDGLIDDLEEKDPSLQRYIEDIEQEVIELRAENERLNSQVEDLEQDLSESHSEYNEMVDEFEWGYAAKEFLEFLVEDRYFAHPCYNSLEKVLDRAEHIVRYGEYKWGF